MTQSIAAFFPRTRKHCESKRLTTKFIFRGRRQQHERKRKTFAIGNKRNELKCVCSESFKALSCVFRCSWKMWVEKEVVKAFKLLLKMARYVLTKIRFESSDTDTMRLKSFSQCGALDLHTLSSCTTNLITGATLEHEDACSTKVCFLRSCIIHNFFKFH